MPGNAYEAVGESYFNLEGDRELYKFSSDDEEEEGQVVLSWRGPPEKTFSDWRIIVVTKSSKPSTFHVHKCILSNGPRSSKYFSKLFSMSKTTIKNLRSKSIVSNEGSTKIELEEKDAKNFPTMMDFIYGDGSMPFVSSGATAATESSSVLTTAASFQLRSTSSSLSMDEETIVSLGEEINTNNAVSLRHLSRLLGCDGLTLSINKYIQRDLSYKTGPIYLIMADEYNDQRLAEASKRLCSENIDKISLRALVRLPIRLMKELIDSIADGGTAMSDNTSLALSEVVYYYMEKNPKLLSPENLLDLTCKIPKVGPEAACGITALVRDMDSKATAAHWTRLVDLCKRCSEAVAFTWTDFSVSSAVDDYLQSVGDNRRSRTDSLLFATSFAAALQHAQNDNARIAKRQEKLETLVKEMQESAVRKDGQLAAQKQTLEDSKRQILYLKKKLSNARQR